MSLARFDNMVENVQKGGIQLVILNAGTWNKNPDRCAGCKYRAGALAWQKKMPLDFNLLKEIREKINIPLLLYGASSVESGDLKKG